MSYAQATRLRDVLLDPVETQRIDVPGSVAAAVLAPLYARHGELHAVFIKRHSELRVHAGQISFPGGRRERGDADLIQTALREAQEEIGLDPSTVTVVGALSPTPTVVTAIAIYPIVGLIPEPTKAWTIETAEVEAVIEASLAELAATHRMQTFTRTNGQRATTDAYTVGDDVAWGATGRIVHELLARLASQAGQSV